MVLCLTNEALINQNSKIYLTATFKQCLSQAYQCLPSSLVPAYEQRFCNGVFI